MSDYKSIIVRNPPASFNKRKIVKNHFLKFGSISRIIVEKNCCFITFDDHEQAKEAKEIGSEWNEQLLDIELVDSNDDRLAEDNLEEELGWLPEDPTGLFSNPIAQHSSFKPERKPLKLRYDPELDSKINKPPKLDVKVKMEESSVIKIEDLSEKRALSAGDKLSLLEERDKLLRIRLDKVSTLNTATVIVGICPDMCPEKERIMRDIRGIVSSYETQDNSLSMDHQKAVKEYTRSSADQEEPLPHELRPEPVLTMTMEYLITNIMCKIDNDPEENLANWYDFCWGRLRSIRKDIIQQQLCNLNTVIIVEQCARFHILCFDRLWGTSKSTFDEKINSETLMNCLQSLMHLYEDLRKQGVLCPNEAEFRAYLILLKLNSGFVLSEYQQFSFDLQQSKEVNDAVGIQAAYSDNMYSTFFCLLRKTTYLNACLMQRFFGPLRTNSLAVIVRSHCPPNKTSKLPVEYIQAILKFDSYDDCVMFCEPFGLGLSEDGSCFFVSRNDFYFPETMFSINSPSSLVENKRVSVTEAVLGHKNIPICVEHQVHSSFNEDGSFKNGALDASDQEEKMLRDTVTRKLLIKRFSSQTPIPLQTKTTESTQLCLDQKPFSFASVPRSNVQLPKTVQDTDDSIEEMDSESSLSEPQDMDYDLSENIEEDAQLSFETDNLSHSEDEDETPSGDDSESSSGSLPHLTFPKIMPPSFKQPISPLKEYKPTAEACTPTFERVSPKITSSMSPNLKKPFSPVTPPAVPVPNFIPSFTAPLEISSTKPKKVVSPPSPLKQVEDIEKKLLMKIKKNEKMIASAKKCAKIWKAKVDMIKHERENRNFSFCPLSVSHHLKLWGTSSGECKTVTLERLRKRKLTGLLVAAILHTNIVDHIDDSTSQLGVSISDKLGERSVQFAHLYGNIAQPQPVFWKLVIALPSKLGGFTFPSKLKSWCHKAFYSGQMSLGEVSYRMSKSGVPVFISVHIIEGLEDVAEHCANLSALAVVRANGWETKDLTVTRLQAIMKHARGPIPVSILTLGEEIEQIFVSKDTQKFTFLEQALLKSTDSLFNTFCQLVNKTHIFNLKIRSLGLLVEVSSEKLLDLLHVDKYNNEGLELILQEPNNIIEFYNFLIEKIEQEIKESCISYNYYGLVCEFEPSIKKYKRDYDLFPKHYQNPEFQVVLSKLIGSLKMKKFKWPFTSSLELLDFFTHYCRDLGSPHILSKLMRMINPPDDDKKVDLNSFLRSIPWLPIIEVIVKEAIKKDLYSFNVVYREDALMDLINSHWWLLSDSVVSANRALSNPD